MSEPNVSQDLFPALPDYTGPNAALFGFLHHDQAWGWSHDVAERVAYCRRNKPAAELAIREQHMVYLGVEALVPADVLAEAARLPAEGARLRTEGDRLWTEADRLRTEAARLWTEGERLWTEAARLLVPYDAAITALAISLVPDCRWNGSEIVF